MAKFGLLYLNDGEYKGDRLLPAAWVDESSQTYSEDAWDSGVGKNFKDVSYWGCSPSGDGETEAQPSNAALEEASEASGSAVEASLFYAIMPGGFLERALKGEFSGTTVTVDGPLAGEEEALFLKSMEAFEEATGIEVNSITDEDFFYRLYYSVDSGEPPDMAIFQQTGMLANFVEMGEIIDPMTWLSGEWLSEQYNASWLDMALMEGPEELQSGGLWYRFNTKSLVC